MSPEAKGTMRTVFALLVGIFLGACGNPTGPNEDPVGVFYLSLVGKQSLPAAYINRPDYRFDYLAGHVRIESNGTYEASLTDREIEAGAVRTSTRYFTGRWSRKGSGMTFWPEEHGWFTSGNLRGDTLAASPGAWPVLHDYLYPFTYIRP